MSDVVIVGLCSGFITLAVCLVNNVFQNKRTMKEFNVQSAKTDTLIECKIDELTRRVDKHNSVIERTYKLEEQTALQEEKIKVANHRIDDLEKERKK